MRQLDNCDNTRSQLTILAYDMNGAPVSVLHCVPLRLRCENELGFKMVKWIKAIVHDFVTPSLGGLRLNVAGQLDE